MTTLILTSSGQFITANNIDNFLPKKITECKIAYISTASKKVFDASYAENFQKKMNELNFFYDDIDIAGMNKNKLKSALSGYDIVFVEGGNTYYLLKAVRESGFENIIKELILKGVIYIGSSAGSLIAGPSIKMATFTERGFERFGITDFTAMNLVPFLIKAHYTPDMMDRLKEDFSNLDFTLRVLTDQQALLIKDGKVQLLGGGEEIIL